ncbi:MAG: DUF3943 domain-containing protein [Prevotella sp.]|jgi:hypothetical protein
MKRLARQRVMCLLLSLVAVCMVQYAEAQTNDTSPLQNRPEGHRLPNIAFGWNHHNDSTLTSKFNIGLVSEVDTLRGFQFGAMFSAVRGTSSGVMTSFLTNAAHSARGLQLAGVSNIAFTPMKAIQLSMLSNTAMGVRQGMQLSLLSNIAEGSMRGVQSAFYNYADTLSGSQIGIFNVALRHPRGVQVGIFNYTRDTIAHKIGLVNINPKTRIDVMLGVGSSSKLNSAIRFRNRSTYNVLGLGTHYMGFDDDFSAALFYRIGQYFHLSPRWTISGDIGCYHIETFHKSTEARPSRLYSLQVHLNLDYDISPMLGAYVSAGYGTTRYYGSHHNYRSRPLVEAGLTFRYRHNINKYKKWEEERERDYQYYLQQLGDKPAGLLYRMDDPQYNKKHWWRAAMLTTGINVLVHCFDRFVMNEDFAQVTFKDIARNWRNAFVWDNDQFSTNLFAHPYHGNLYFNSARSNGLNFWESAPYALGGSLMWEFCGEVEPPAINDLMATTFGGICIGEITHRLSALLLNDSKRGSRRFWREAAATVVNPMQGLTRIIDGDAWKHRDTNYLYHDFSKIPVEFTVNFGSRYLADKGSFSRGEYQPYLQLQLVYGDIFSEENKSPYDFFTTDITVGLSGNQPLLNNIHLLGKLWSTTVYRGNEGATILGLFQHFNYYDSEPVKDGSDQTPYRISEAASVGPGIIWRFPKLGNLTMLRQALFVDGILLGGTKSDYYNVIDRDYNMGSGYSVKFKSLMLFENIGAFMFLADYYRIYTWKGYEDKDLSTVNPLYLNAQGDKGNAELLVLSPRFVFHLKNNIGIDLSGFYYLRHTRYDYHPNVHANTFEVRAALVFRL